MSDRSLSTEHSVAVPLLSVVICTYNRASLLVKVLESLCKQTLPAERFEIVIINDGSTDDTETAANVYAKKLPLRYFYQRNAGLASAKNHGLFASRGDLVFFMDDDDVASEVLLEEHVKTHLMFPAQHYAVLGYTALSPEISGNPLMHFVTEIGCFLFSYPSLKNGEVLDYSYFWGGRSSCKRSFLLEHGVFNPVFRFGAEDIELGYRLSKHGLRVIYNRNAISIMVRKMDFDAFCHRLERQGASSYVVSRLHPEEEIQRWTDTIDLDKNWAAINGDYDAIVRSARHLDSIANLKLSSGFELDDVTRDLTYRGYWIAFRACKLKGAVKSRELYSASFNSRATEIVIP
ncbi:Glycosyl transferase family 2 [Nitrosospira multiformis]|nr:glycosyltransferase family A protein [Nitrosospira multiformis]SEA43347.1 Glycosyl transferase family 2 [Nitrosospira multiformis]